jgi:hypothetical protein
MVAKRCRRHLQAAEELYFVSGDDFSRAVTA